MRRSFGFAAVDVRLSRSCRPALAMGVRYLMACSVGLAACFLITSASPGKYAAVEVQQVPVERLVTNLERAVKKNPRDVQALVNLARVHGMAYALKTDTAPVQKGHEDRGPWFGYEPKIVPFSTVKKWVRGKSIFRSYPTTSPD